MGLTKQAQRLSFSCHTSATTPIKVTSGETDDGSAILFQRVCVICAVALGPIVKRLIGVACNCILRGCPIGIWSIGFWAYWYLVHRYMLDWYLVYLCLSLSRLLALGSCSFLEG